MQMQIDYQPFDVADAMAAAKTTSTTPEFSQWLVENFAIFKRFAQEADAVRQVREHYSARTIWEHIRHETVLRERGVFKLNNNFAPSCARVYMHLRGCAKFFETRGS